MDSPADNLPGAVQELRTPDRIRHLENQVSQLQQAVTSHAVIDQAIGVIVAVGHMTPEEAWAALCETSMCTTIKLRHVADLVVACRQGERELAADVRDELSRRLKRQDLQ